MEFLNDCEFYLLNGSFKSIEAVIFHFISSPLPFIFTSTSGDILFKNNRPLFGFFWSFFLLLLLLLLLSPSSQIPEASTEIIIAISLTVC